MREDVIVRYVFMAMIAMADKDGVVDIIHDALARKLNIPETDLKNAIEKLESPDDASRSNVADGRRLSRIDAHRSWGWQIINYGYYSKLATRQEKREKDRSRIAEKRAISIVSQDVATCRSLSQSVADVAQVEVEGKREVVKRVCVNNSSSQVGKVTKAGIVVNGFEEFWRLYPKKVGKGAAVASWKKLRLSQETQSRIFAAVWEQSGLEQWQKDSGRFIPNPATWLNQCRWEDEVKTESNKLPENMRGLREWVKEKGIA